MDDDNTSYAKGKGRFVGWEEKGSSVIIGEVQMREFLRRSLLIKLEPLIRSGRVRGSIEESKIQEIIDTTLSGREDKRAKGFIQEVISPLVEEILINNGYEPPPHRGKWYLSSGYEQ